MVRAAAERALYGVGLGFGFYIMLGSFINERFNAKTIIGTGILIQVIVSLLATMTIVYAIAPSSPERLLLYAYGGEEQAIKLMGGTCQTYSRNIPPTDLDSTLNILRRAYQHTAHC